MPLGGLVGPKSCSLVGSLLMWLWASPGLFSGHQVELWELLGPGGLEARIWTAVFWASSMELMESISGLYGISETMSSFVLSMKGGHGIHEIQANVCI